MQTVSTEFFLDKWVMKKFLDNIGKQGSKLQLKEVEVKFVVNDQDVTSKFLLRPLKMVNRYSRQFDNPLIGWNYSIQTAKNISTNLLEFITGHMVYNLAYT